MYERKSIVRLKFTLFLFAIGVAMFPSVHAKEPRSVDPRTFDVAGVKTGMDYNEARAALAAHFKVPVSEVKPGPMNLKNPATEAAWIIYEKDGVRVQAGFVTRVPIDKNRPLVIWHIDYSIPWTKQNEEALRKAAIEKYGETSNGESWCGKPNPNPGMGCFTGAEQATLKVGSTGLNLIDPAWRIAYDQYRDSLKAVKPSL
jgi:hypothetical protein